MVFIHSINKIPALSFYNMLDATSDLPAFAFSCIQKKQRVFHGFCCEILVYKKICPIWTYLHLSLKYQWLGVRNLFSVFW